MKTRKELAEVLRRQLLSVPDVTKEDLDASWKDDDMIFSYLRRVCSVHAPLATLDDVDDILEGNPTFGEFERLLRIVVALKEHDAQSGVI